jgi:hypothetical protein
MSRPLRRPLQARKDKREGPDLYPYLRLDAGAEVGIIALSPGERVARVRRFH